MISLMLMTVSLFAQQFSGTWLCTVHVPPAHGRPAFVFHSTWSIAPAPGKAWTVVRWGPRTSQGGIAYVGYVPQEHEWVYEDFHYDGSYALSSSAGPHNGVWTWAGGGYYTARSVSRGVVTWKRTTPTRLNRSYARVINGKPVPQGTDSCTLQK